MLQQRDIYKSHLSIFREQMLFLSKIWLFRKPGFSILKLNELLLINITLTIVSKYNLLQLKTTGKDINFINLNILEAINNINQYLLG